MRHRTLVAVTTTALLAALTTGCRDSEPAAAPPQPSYTGLSLPAELLPRGVTVEQVGVLGASGGAPWSVHAIRTAAGDRPRAVVWPAQDGVLPGNPVDLDVDGDAESLAVAGSADLTVAVVGSSVDGEDATAVRTTTDRRTWAAVAVPQLDDVAVTSVAVSGHEALIIGTSRITDEQIGVILTTNEPPEVIPMPTSPDGIEATLHPRAAAVNGDELAVVTDQDRGGDADVVSVYRSADRGATWAEDVIEGDHVQVSGFSATAHGFVLTGHVRLTRDARVLIRPAVWTATAGTPGFRAEAEPSADDTSGDAWIGAPAPAGEGYRFLLGGPYDTTVSALDQDGQVLAVSARLPERGMFGPTAVDADGTTRSVAAGQHGAIVLELGQAASGESELVRQVALAFPQRWFAPYDQESTGVLTAGKRQVEDWHEGWRAYTKQARYVLDAEGAGLTAAPDDAVTVGEGAWRIDATGPGGDVAIVEGFRVDGDGIETATWARATDGEWVQGSLAGDVSNTEAPLWVAGQWLLPGTTGPSTDIEDPDTAALWASGDGLTWNPADGFPGTPGQRAHTVCALGDEDALVLGSDHGDPLVWVRSGGVWQTSPATADGRRTPTGCYVAADGRTVIRFVEGDGVRLLATADGTTLDEVLATGDDSRIGTVRAVPGGFAATGSVRDEGQRRAVLWVSADGLEWHHLSGPAGEDGLADLTVIDGTVVVMTGDDRGTRAWRVDGLQEAMSAASAKMDE